MSLIQNIQHRFKQGNIVEKIIYINLTVFIGTLLINVFQGLYKNESHFIVEWFSLNANYSAFFSKPWSIISYGFLHADFLHPLRQNLDRHRHHLILKMDALSRTNTSLPATIHQWYHQTLSD